MITGRRSSVAPTVSGVPSTMARPYRSDISTNRSGRSLPPRLSHTTTPMAKAANASGTQSKELAALDGDGALEILETYGPKYSSEMFNVHVLKLHGGSPDGYTSALIELPPPRTRPWAYGISRLLACFCGAVARPQVNGPEVILAKPTGRWM